MSGINVNYAKKNAYLEERIETTLKYYNNINDLNMKGEQMQKIRKSLYRVQKKIELNRLNKPAEKTDPLEKAMEYSTKEAFTPPQSAAQESQPDKLAQAAQLTGVRSSGQLTPHDADNSKSHDLTESKTHTSYDQSKG